LRLLLAGPTAVGKTELSLILAEELGIPIISADSRQCYKYMDIGTGKVSTGDLSHIKHYNISIFDPDIDDNISKFHKRALKWEEELSHTCNIYFYVGGSTLYLESLIRPLDEIPGSNRENLRDLEKLESEFGLDHLYNELRQVDPVYVSKMDGMNRQRIFRALDVFMQTGKPFSHFHKQNKDITPLDDTLVFVLNRDREKLHQRISKRVDKMMETGLVEEVKSIVDMGYSPDLNALQTVGYREIISFLEHKISLDRAVELIKRNSRRYAKRQITWFRRWNNVIWLNIDTLDMGKAKRLIIDHIKSVAANGNNR
jgi:tRNA dimethylallyltransferase